MQILYFAWADQKDKVYFIFLKVTTVWKIKYSLCGNTVQLWKLLVHVSLFFFQSKHQWAVHCIVNIIMHVFCGGGWKLENMHCNLQLSIGRISIINKPSLMMIQYHDLLLFCSSAPLRLESITHIWVYSYLKANSWNTLAHQFLHCIKLSLNLLLLTHLGMDTP